MLPRVPSLEPDRLRRRVRRTDRAINIFLADTLHNYSGGPAVGRRPGSRPAELQGARSRGRQRSGKLAKAGRDLWPSLTADSSRSAEWVAPLPPPAYQP